MKECEVMSKVIEALGASGLEIKSCVYGDGYYIFEFGKDSVAHIVFRGLRDWLWGVWVINKDGDDTEHRVSLFGEHRYYIDKFKPTAVAVSREFTVTDDEFTDPDVDVLSDNVWGFVRDVKNIKRHRLGEEYRLYGDGDGFLGYHLRKFVNRRIRRPFRKFKEGWLSRSILKAVALVYTLRFRRRFGERDNDFHVNVVTRGRGWWPKHILQIVYGDMSDEEVVDVYFKINRRAEGEWGYDIDRPWLVPAFVCEDLRVTNAEDDNDFRGFRFKDKADEDDGEDDEDGEE